MSDQGTTRTGDLLANALEPRTLLNLLKRSDIALGLGVVAILTVLVLPLPPWLLDMALALSFTFSVLVLMTALFIEKALDFSAFPTVLLIATLLRLSLNLASTRLILGNGAQGTDAAGQVIEAFGGFIMQGNFVIGIIVFAILVIVNFIVITKGAGRIAEVTARFSLDSMPGKQMAIDADLSSGLIDEQEAKRRRQELEDESNFFGSMDGAAKFVRGDAIAGLLITFINIIGGMVIGMAQQGMTFSQAANTYTQLTVGDGLVTQIPALLVSTGAGLLISKSKERGSTDKALFGQLGMHPRALGVTATLMVLMSLVPGVPFIPFMLLGALAATLAYLSYTRGVPQPQREGAAAAAEAANLPAEQGQDQESEDTVADALAIDQVRLEMGYGLLTMVNREGARLTDQIKALRKQLAQEMGFVLPSVRIQDNLQLPANTYVIRIKEIEAARGDIRPDSLLVMDPGGQDVPLQGQKTTEPAFGLPAMWVDEGQREEALFRGYTVVDPPTVVTTHLTELVKDNMAELLSYAETQKLLDELDRDQQKLVNDIIPSAISVGGLQRVLQNLLAERVSIRDLPSILEAIAEATGYTRNINLITEHVRSRLARQICNAHTNEQGYIPIVTLSPQWEQAFSESIVGDGEDKQLSMAPSKLQDFINQLKQTFERQAMMGELPVLLTSPSIRAYVRSIVERFRPQTPVLSQNEIHPKARIKTLGQI